MITIADRSPSSNVGTQSPPGLPARSFVPAVPRRCAWGGRSVGAGGVVNAAWTTRRCDALKRGLHVVSVSSGVVVFATTAVSLGLTTSEPVTR